MKFNTWKDSLEAVRLVLKDEYKRHTELAADGLEQISDRYYDTDMQKIIRSTGVDLNTTDYYVQLIC